MKLTEEFVNSNGWTDWRVILELSGLSHVSWVESGLSQKWLTSWPTHNYYEFYCAHIWPLTTKLGRALEGIEDGQENESSDNSSSA